jgi:hypothetical protein
MKYLYKYPQRAYPYGELVTVNRSRSRYEMEYELLDTGAFDENRYFDIVVEYSKATPEDILIQIAATNRGPEAATLQLLPTIWFRNTWAWQEGAARPVLKGVDSRPPALSVSHPVLGEHCLCYQDGGDLLVTDNETNYQRLYGVPNRSAYVKDGINDYVVTGRRDAVNPERTGTKAAIRFEARLEPGETRTLHLRLSDNDGECHPLAKSGAATDPLGEAFDRILTARRAEADEFYREVFPEMLSDDQRNVMRQALAGMLWS